MKAWQRAKVAANPRAREVEALAAPKHPRALHPREGETRRKELIRRQEPDLKQEPSQRGGKEVLDPMARRVAAARRDAAQQAKDQQRVNRWSRRT